MMDKKTVYVIHTVNSHGEVFVIGVVDEPNKAFDLIKEYYGEYKQLSFRDIRDSGTEWEMKIEWGLDLTVSFVDDITLFSFNINEL